MNAALTIRHLRTREETEPGKIIRYYALCGANGTAGRDFPKELDRVSCVKCWAKTKTKRVKKGA